MPVALAAPWTHRFLGALVEKENGRLDLALEHLQSLLQGGFPEAAGRGFDFSQDLRVQSEIGQTAWLLSQASPEGPARSTHLETARAAFERALAIDPEDLAAHWGLMLVHGARGDAVRAEAHRAEHARYKPDDNARDTAVARARQVPWANHAAEPVVVYELR
jgi:tetratricopeptide (TPR) repeat protein